MKNLLNFTLILSLVVLSGCATTNGPSVDGNPQYAFQVVSTTTTRGLARDVWVDGNTAYIADDQYGVTIWDVSDLKHPVMIDSIQTITGAKEVGYSAETNLLFVMVAGNVVAYNLTDKSLQIQHGNGAINAFRFKVLQPDTLLLIEVEPDNDACQLMVSYKEPLSFPQWPYDYHSAYTPAYGRLNSLELDSNYVYFAHSQHGVSIIQYNYADIGPTFNATVLGRIDTPGSAQDLALSRDRNYVFVADNQTGLQVVDISNKNAPRIVGSVQPPNVNDAIRVRAIGDTAIFVEQYRGIYAINCDVPTSPHYFGTFACNDPQGIFIRESDKTIFLTDLDQGLIILKFRVNL